MKTISRSASYSWLILVAAITAAQSLNAHAVEISVGPRELIYKKSQRISLWPDGNLGPVPNGNGTYDFYAANGSSPVRTTGTLDDPNQSKKSVKIRNKQGSYDYMAGGPVYQDPTTGLRLMIYHAEKHGKSKSNFHSVLGMAVATDDTGLNFTDLGTIIEPNVPSGLAEVGGGSFAVFDGYFNVYYKDWLQDGSTAEVAVARASLSDVINNALSGQVTSFNKFYNGDWTEPGRGGKSSYLETTNAANSWLSVSYNDYIDQLVMVSSQWAGDGGDLYLATSPDGINWSARQPVAVNPGEQFYPSVIGVGADPTHSGKSFYVYYTDSKKGIWSRWKDAELVRRTVWLDAPPADGFDEDAGVMQKWVDVAAYKEDFQSGAPAEGWTYAWNPKGKAGKSSQYVPLQWSESQMVYNTTGTATQAPNPKTHPDDNLHLSYDGGHPGNKKYMPIIGYTIQQEDGAGFYRIADSTIGMNNDSTIPKEDAVELLVYVNDKLMNEGAPVGLYTTFDQELGQLNVGDTVWVMIDPLKNQFDDSFRWFDFSIQKWDYVVQALPLAAQFGSFSMSAAVPEPSGAALCMFALCVYVGRSRSRIIVF